MYLNAHFDKILLYHISKSRRRERESGYKRLKRERKRNTWIDGL